jgi:hypothetical protein
MTALAISTRGKRRIATRGHQAASPWFVDQIARLEVKRSASAR